MHCDSSFFFFFLQSTPHQHGKRRTFHGFDVLGSGDVIILQRGPFGGYDDEVVGSVLIFV
jgi:hypothetical protein